MTRLYRKLEKFWFGPADARVYAVVRIVFAAVVSVLFLVGGFRHPRPLRFAESLGGVRIFLAILAVAIFVTSFMLVPVTLPRVFFQ